MLSDIIYTLPLSTKLEFIQVAATVKCENPGLNVAAHLLQLADMGSPLWRRLFHHLNLHLAMKPEEFFYLITKVILKKCNKYLYLKDWGIKSPSIQLLLL